MLELKYGDLVEFQWYCKFPTTGIGYNRGDCGFITETDEHDPLYYEVERVSTYGARTGIVFKIAKKKAEEKLKLLVSNTENNMGREVEVGKIYQHFKGGMYLVTGLAHDCDNYRKRFVIYSSVDSGTLFARSRTEFLSEVPAGKEHENKTKQKYRFELAGTVSREPLK